MKPTTGWPRPVSHVLLAAAGLIGAATALAPVVAGGHAGVHIRQAASTSAAVTTTMGPIAADSVALHSGPGYGYATAGFAKPLTTYAVNCFSAPGINPGAAGPYNISDMTTVWYLLANPATPAQGIGYILSTDPANQFSIANAGIPDQVGRCASDPPPPVPASSSTGESVSAQTPQKCARGILSQGLNTITVHSFTGHLDIEFTSAVPAPQNVDVQDESTGQSGDGYALTDQKATYHFTEDKNTTFGDHTLSINVDGGLGGPNGELAPVLGDPIVGGASWGNGDTIDGDVSWEVVSGGCIA